MQQLKEISHTVSMKYYNIIIIINTETSHIRHCTHSAESADVEDHQNQRRNEGDTHRTAY